MESYALLIGATLSAGTVLAIAALGLLINEKAGIVNLGAEGMMLCAAIAGFATVVHTGNTWLGFAAGMAAGAPVATIFGVRVARVGPCTGLPRAPYSLGRRGGRWLAVRAGRGVHLYRLHPAVGGGYGGRARLDRAGADHLCHVAPGTGVAWCLPVWRRDHAAVPFAGHGRASGQPVAEHAALCGDHRGAGADLAQSGVDPHQHAGMSGQAVLSGFVNKHWSQELLVTRW